MDDAICALPIAWLDVTDIGIHYFKKISVNQLQAPSHLSLAAS